MPAILIRILTWLMTSIAGQVLFSLGMGVLSFSALNSVSALLIERLELYFVGTSQNMLIFMQLFDIPYGLSVIISAFLIKTTIMSAQVALAKK